MKNLSKLARNVAKLSALPWSKKWLLAKVFIVLSIYKFLLFIFPFNQFFKADKTYSYAKTSPSETDLNAIIWAITVVSNQIPLGFTCLIQALSAKWLLKNHPDVRVCIGVHKSTTQGFSAHAWVVHKNRIVLGKQATQQFEPILEWN